jgi:flagellin-like protein
MLLLPICFLRSRGSLRPSVRIGVSELYATLLMIAITLTLGSAVTAAAIGQYGEASSGSSVAASLEQQAVSGQVSLVIASVSQGSCPTYRGAPDGTTLQITLFNYGTEAFEPSGAVVNGTVYHASSYRSMAPGTMGTYSIPLTPSGTCAHSSGQTVLLTTASGGEVQLGT